MASVKSVSNLTSPRALPLAASSTATVVCGSFLVAFLPGADQPGASWVFAQAPPLTRELVQDATWRALVTHVLAPVHLLAIVLACSAGPNGLASLPARPL